MLYRMGKKTSIYLSDDLAEHAGWDARSIPELIRHALATRPLLIEKNETAGFTTHWYCAVPEMGTKFKVLRDHWRSTAGEQIREIYEIAAGES